MQYSTGQLSRIKATLFSKIVFELDSAVSSNTVDDFLKKYDIIFEEECIPVNTRTMRILVFGALVGNINSYKAAAKSLGINPSNIVFENDYEKLTNYDSERIRNSYEFSDIIMGSNPHKIKNVGNYRSFSAKIKAEQNQFPRLIESPDKQSLKLSISSFKNCLVKTRFYEALSNN